MSLRRKSLPALALLPVLALASGGCGDDPPPAPGRPAEYPEPYEADGSLARGAPRARARPDLLLVVIEEWTFFGGIVASDRPFLRGNPLKAWQGVTPVPEPTAAIASLLTGRLASRHGASHRDPVPLLHSGYVTLPEILRSQGYATRAFVAGERLARGTTLWQGCEIEPRRVGLVEAPAALAAWVASLPKDTPYFAIVHADEATPPYGEANHVPRVLASVAERPPADGAEAAAELFLLDRAGYASLREARRRRGGEDEVAELEREVKRFFWAPPRAAIDPGDTTNLAARARDAQSRSFPWVDGLVSALRRTADSLRGAPPVSVWTSTGGDAAWAKHGSLRPGRHLYDEQIRVPLHVLGLDEEKKGHDEVASLVDVLPTLLDLLGLPPPADIDGVSLLPVARGERHRPPVVSEATQDGENTGDPTVRANLVSVRSARWKYVIRLDLREGTVVEEAYDLTADGGERTNLAKEGSVSGVPFDAETCAAIERVRDGIWGQVTGANAVAGGPYSMGAKILTERPRPCGR